MELSTDGGYQQLLAEISDTYTQGQVRATQAVNALLGETCKPIGATLSHLLRCSHIFDSLKIPEPHPVSENELQTLLCDHLQPFMLELSKDNHYFNVRLYELLDGAGERLMRGEKP
jgi:predicted nuclease of restriction endonuclease-like (RecB) superfamily